MKTVFTSREIAHVWAHKGAPHGRSPGNASFDGDAFKSYATVIGRRIEHAGKTAFVLDCASFSRSTSKVQAWLRHAIDHAVVFRVEVGVFRQSLHFTPKTLRDHYLAAYKRVSDSLPSRYAHKRAAQYRAATAQLEQARRVCLVFDLKTARIDAMLAKRTAGDEAAADILQLARERLLAAQVRRDARTAAERKARNIEQAERFLADPKSRPKSIVRPLSDDAPAAQDLPADLRERLREAITAHNAGLTARWRAGEGITIPQESPVMLRAVGEEMETSRGARVPLSDARAAVRFCRRHRVKGWHCNGQTFTVGGYALDAVNTDGVVAGCHRIAWPEIELFAASQGW